jgi:antitoxin PrlF
VTGKGQTTLLLAARQVLGVPDGGRISVRIEGKTVTIAVVEEDHRDPAIGAFLRLIAAGRNLGNLPADLAATLVGALDEIDADLDERILGDVCL